MSSSSFDTSASGTASTSDFGSSDSSGSSSSADASWSPAPQARYRKRKAPRDPPTVLVIKGSQYCAKVLTALDSKGVDYRITILPPMGLKKKLPAPHLVPVVDWDGAGDLIPDSGRILRHFDKVLQDDGCPFMPDDEEVEHWEKYLANVFNLYVLYFNWVDNVGFKRSIGKQVRKAMPCFLACVPVSVPVKSHRKEVAKRCRDAGIACKNREDATEGLIKELHYIDNALRDSDSEYLSGYDYPTAPDFGLYSMLSRLMDFTGDSGLAPSYPGICAKAGTRRVTKFYNMMKSRYPIQFFKQGKMRKEYPLIFPTDKFTNE